MGKNEIIKIVIKVLIYALTLVGAALGVQALSSCAVQHSRDYDLRGRAVIVTTDTTVIQHNGQLTFKSK